ncbi:MAG: ABC transporter permease subunit, partial [Bacteriovoracales bacterium]|nr:ABC transporter permease subunit [Bacteriovoracales bacterium]
MNIKHITTVSKYTFHEIYKTNIFLSTIFIGFLICIVTILATKLSFGAVHKVSLDISLGLISLSVKVISLVYGINLLGKEIEQRTLHVVLSRSVSRGSFLVGKISGLGLILIVNTMAVALIGILAFIFF